MCFLREADNFTAPMPAWRESHSCLLWKKLAASVSERCRRTDAYSDRRHGRIVRRFEYPSQIVPAQFPKERFHGNAKTFLPLLLRRPLRLGLVDSFTLRIP